LEWVRFVSRALSAEHLSQLDVESWREFDRSGLEHLDAAVAAIKISKVGFGVNHQYGGPPGVPAKSLHQADDSSPVEPAHEFFSR
jgi:hypothetical protein